MHRSLILLAVCCSVTTARAASTAVWLDDRFELRPGFRIYRAATGELSGGSYALTFDGQGRLLVGDGNAVRRLVDTNDDGVFDKFEMIASGLGPRGPQGLLVYQDELFAVGGDGLQRFSGYQAGGPLRHRGRLGNKLGTGGDHDAHSLVRGHDGWIYLMAGNGSGLTNRQHITEKSSPALFEREASVFRISPDGARWECLASGGRNPPSLGQNYLGDWFSFDSDMEWHVGLPWYRPVRLNHWLVGGDQGWQEVGAYPPYFIDNLPGILDVGRGSPNWGVFYEHTQFPETYLNAFLVCDYRWKGASDDKYATSGRLVAFFPRPQASRWTATMETLVRPRPDARDPDGRPIQFALVDVAVAPDGSLFLSDHNQGIWRLCYLPGTQAEVAPPKLVTPWPEPGPSAGQALDTLLALPQPGSERTRLREQELSARLGKDPGSVLRHAARNGERPLSQRLRAVRLLSPDFAKLPADFVKALALDPAWELRAQGATLLGWRGGEESAPRLLRMLDDKEPFVRRRAIESLARVNSASATRKLIVLLEDGDRSVRYAAMVALSHRPTQEWFFQPRLYLQTQVRVLTAAYLRQEPAAEAQTKEVFRWILPSGPIGAGWTNSTTPIGVDPNVSSQTPRRPARAWPSPAPPRLTFTNREDRLDLLRVLALYQNTISSDPDLLQRVHALLLSTFPDDDRDVRWEQARLLGAYRSSKAFPVLLQALEKETEPVTQFHLAQALALLPDGWSPAEEQRALTWFLGTQTGWFAEFSGKGVQFPEFWATVLTDFAAAHRPALLQQSAKLNWASLLGGVALNLIASTSRDGAELLQLYETNPDPRTRLKILQALRGTVSAKLIDFLQAEHGRIDTQTREGAELQGAILQYWAAHPTALNRPFLLYEGLFHDDAQVVRSAARALASEPAAIRQLLDRNSSPKLKQPKSSQADLANDLIQRMEERPELFAALEEILAAWSGQPRPGFKPGLELRRRVDEKTRSAALKHWREWAGHKFGAPSATTASSNSANQKAKSDAELHRFLLSDAGTGGNVERGASVYEKLQCQTCHGGGLAPGREGRLFGPDLAGVTRRLTRPELADALVYPSKLVADRFKAIEITLKDGTSITGFITEQNADSITIAEREQVRKLARSSVQNVAPLSTSLMPETLLNRLSWEELGDLMSFLQSK